MSDQDELTRKSPEELGIQPRAILDFLRGVETKELELHSFMLLRHGSVAAEGWWSPYRRELPHMLFSLSKSFTSSAIGLAVMEGRLSVDDVVISFFPDDVPQEIGANLAAMKIRHLLCMSTGHAEDTTQRMIQKEGSSWVRTFLSLPVEHQPGTHFVYNSGASYMLSAIIQKVTGQTLFEYLKPRLFEPLGIEEATWELSPQGINTGGWGLSIKTEDIARFGQLYLQRGVWNGRRILSEEWVREATSCQVSNGDGGASDWAQGYGYQFWRCRHGAYRGDGAFGQNCIVLPEQDAVVAITSHVKDLQAVLNLVWEHLLPGMGSEPLSPNDQDRADLEQVLASLALPLRGTRLDSPRAKQVSGRHFSVAWCEGHTFDVSFSFEKDMCTAQINDGKKQYALQCGLGKWIESETVLPGEYSRDGGPVRVAASGAWADDNAFVVTCQLIETPFHQTATFCFEGDELRVNLSPDGANG